MRNSVLIAASVAKDAARNQGDIKSKFRAAFEELKEFWLPINDDEKIRAAIVAVYELSTEEEKALIETEITGLKIISAMMDGVPVDQKIGRASCRERV